MSAAYACESNISGLGQAFLVTHTLEMGDLVIPRTYQQALASPEASYWREAINKELRALLDIGTFEFLRLQDLPPHANILRCHMLFTVKRNQDGSVDKFKCRLVADGNSQQWGLDFNRVFSTVAKISTLRLTLAVAAARDYNLTCADIRQAYLQATLTEDLYMRVPPGLPATDASGQPLVVKLRRSLYGLRQAGREWFHLFASTLCTYGFKPSSIDTCLFIYTSSTSILWLVLWVDDCVILDNDPSLRTHFLQYLSSRHPTDDKGELTWVLQVRVTRDRAARTISLSQQLYINDLLQRYGSLLDGLTRRFDSPYDAAVTFSSDQCPLPGSPEHDRMAQFQEDYMALTGAYLWLANVTRPDLAYIASQLARFVSNPAASHYRAALRVLVYLRTSASQMLTLRPDPSAPLCAYVDADWATKFSVSGGIISFMSAPIHWFSRAQRSISMSSTEAEFFAMCAAVKEVLFFRDLLRDLGFDLQGPTRMATDNRSVVDLSFDAVAFKKTKHILRAAEFVRDLAHRRVIQVHWIAGHTNPADLLTKPVALVTFRKLFAFVHDLPKF